MEHKFNSHLSRYHSDLKIVHDINREQRRKYSPVLMKIKKEEQMVKERDRQLEEEKQQLMHKKLQYAKYVNDIIRPTIKVRSQEKSNMMLLQQIKPIKRKLQIVKNYNNKLHQDNLIERINRTEISPPPT